MQSPVDGNPTMGLWYLHRRRSSREKNGKNTMNKLMTAVWDDNACVTSGAYVVEATGWWSEDGKGWYGVESSADLKNSTILFLGGHLDGSYNK
jgi:hypothetical protein